MSLFRSKKANPSSPEARKPTETPFIGIQAKLKVGKSNDKYEQEADRVADKVVNRKGFFGNEPFFSPARETNAQLQEEEVQQKPIANEVTPLVQKTESVDDEPVQKTAEEDPIQKKEEEESLQMKEEEESVQMKGEEESVQTKEEYEIQKMEEEESVQMKNQGSSTTDSPSIESRLNSSKGGGQKLSGKTKNVMESGFGNDFSDVNIHTDQNAIQLSQDLGAKAFAHGNDVYFNKGQYNPESREGKHLLAHELTHTIQQKGMVQKKVQRHMQKSYPWDGIVSATYSGALRKVPKKKEGWIADIPKGTRMTVVGNSNNWLNVRVMVGGIQKTGYISQELVSLAKTNVVAEMESMVGDKAKWVGSGPSKLTKKSNTFVTWAEAKTEADAPKLKSVTTINCWEMVLLAAYRSGAITWKFIHDLYLNNKGSWGKELPNRLTKGGQAPYSVATKKPVPKRGQLVFFDGAAHVALATGSGDKILTFWPPPNTKFTPGGTVDDVKVSSISALYNFMKKNMSTPKVTIGNPIW